MPDAGISIHVVDVSRGLMAAGMRSRCIALAPARVRIANASGFRESAWSTILLCARGSPRASTRPLLQVGDYYRRVGVALPPVPFLDVVTYRFGIADPEQHYHLPFKLTPWGYSCFRGGA